jgi:hypothetical protein
MKESNLLCPSNFIRLYKNENNNTMGEKKVKQYNSMNKQFKEDNSNTSENLSDKDIMLNHK